MDRVKPLKIEDSTSGTQADPFPVETNPLQDYLATKGISFENLVDRYFDLDGSGNVQFRDLVETTPMPLWKLRRAIYEIFNPAGSPLVSTNSEDAIKEVFNYFLNSGKTFVFEYYGGNANAGRVLDMFPGISMDEAPLEIVNPFVITRVVARTTAATATCDIGFYDIQSGTPVLLHTTTFSNVKKVVESGAYATPVFTLPASCQLMVKIASGSINKPHIYFSGIGG